MGEGILIIFIVNMSRSKDHLSIVHHKAFIHHNVKLRLKKVVIPEKTPYQTLLILTLNKTKYFRFRLSY